MRLIRACVSAARHRSAASPGLVAWAVCIAAAGVWGAAPVPSGSPMSRPARDPDFLKRQQAEPLAPRPRVTGIEHTVLHYDKSTYCGHPRMVGFQYFGNGEIVVGHFHAPCKYEVYEDVRHANYQARAVCLLQRSTDYGRTWPKENDVVIYDCTQSWEQQDAFLSQPDAPRERYDMFKPQSMFFSQHTSPLRDICASFFLRSPDKGHTWEKVPTVLTHPAGKDYWLRRHSTPVIRMPDGRTLLAAFQMADADGGSNTEGDPAIFSSVDQGLSWQFLSRPMVDLSGEGHFNYVTLLLTPDGDLHCYTLHLKRTTEAVDGMLNAICLSISRDGGRTWGPPVPIVGQGGDCWQNPGSEGVIYRSPWPILLQDGRILVVFARRRMPGGIGGVVSADGGRTWSQEFVLRDDAKWWDLGYPVGCQLEDGRVFIAYYFNKEDGNGQGGTRYIAATFFKVE